MATSDTGALDQPNNNKRWYPPEKTGLLIIVLNGMEPEQRLNDLRPGAAVFTGLWVPSFFKIPL